jgi:regulator of sigma D
MTTEAYLFKYVLRCHFKIYEKILQKSIFSNIGIGSSTQKNCTVFLDRTDA